MEHDPQPSGKIIHYNSYYRLLSHSFEIIIRGHPNFIAVGETSLRMQERIDDTISKHETFLPTLCHSGASIVNRITCVRFGVFTAVTMKNADFWDVAPCRP
jgi:hypothetical protein